MESHWKGSMNEVQSDHPPIKSFEICEISNFEVSNFVENVETKLLESVFISIKWLSFPYENTRKYESAQIVIGSNSFINLGSRLSNRENSS